MTSQEQSTKLLDLTQESKETISEDEQSPTIQQVPSNSTKKSISQSMQSNITYPQNFTKFNTPNKHIIKDCKTKVKL